ncbi:thioredoxin [Paenibacillus sp. DYY-L-2]|uniref:thioredoxin n=1 Tax=Paenibacillus sp. DYY-L-2 TaxID=3447013 RepID=UPI003F4FB39F
MSATALTKATFSSQIEKGVTLVDFWAPWCGPCKIQLPIVHELAEELNGQATIATVNVDEQIELASQFGVRSIPTLLLFKDGELVDQMVGINGKDVLKGKISRLASN